MSVEEIGESQRKRIEILKDQRKRICNYGKLI